MPRSPLTEIVRKVSAIAEQIHALPQEEKDYLLDLLVPEPEPAKKPQKRSSKKVVGGGGKSKRGESIKGQLNKSLQGQRKVTTNDDDDGHNLVLCGHGFDGGGTCKRSPDHNIHHLQTDSLYHEFQPAATSAGKSDAQSAAGGS